MLSAHRSAAAFRRDASVSSWLYRIVVNACLDRLRRNKTHPTIRARGRRCSVGDPTPRVDTALMVERALMRLPVEQRAAVVAVDMQGYSVAETARLLGVPEGTVKSRCSRARAKLAEALGYLATTPAAADRWRSGVSPIGGPVDGGTCELADGRAGSPGARRTQAGLLRRRRTAADRVGMPARVRRDPVA